jgi:hypothetical protein
MKVFVGGGALFALGKDVYKTDRLTEVTEVKLKSTNVRSKDAVVTYDDPQITDRKSCSDNSINIKI